MRNKPTNDHSNLHSDAQPNHPEPGGRPGETTPTNGESLSGAQPLPQLTTASAGELHIGTFRITARGRALRLMLWLATHQQRINHTAPDNGQLWLTWKGERLDAINGDIKTSL